MLTTSILSGKGVDISQGVTMTHLEPSGMSDIICFRLFFCVTFYSWISSRSKWLLKSTIKDFWFAYTTD